MERAPPPPSLVSPLMPQSTLIIGDHSVSAARFRQQLVQLGWDCPPSSVVSVENALPALDSASANLRLLFVVLTGEFGRTLELLESLRERTAARIVVVGRVDDANTILDAVHKGADDYLDEQGDLPNQLLRCLQRLRKKEQTTSSAGKMIALAAPCGGSGASFLAANLAAALAQRTGGCTLLDLDLRHGDQSSLFNLSPRHTVADLCRNIDSLDAPMLEQSLTAHPCGVRVLAAPDEPAEAFQIDRVSLQRIVQLSRTLFPVTLLDFPTALDEAHFEMLSSCDAIIMAFRLDFASLRNLRRLLTHFDHREIDSSKVHLIANRCGLPKELSASKIKNALQREIRLTIDDDPQVVNLSVNCGSPVVLESPQSPIATSIQLLAKSLAPGSGANESAAASSSTTLIDFLKSRLLSSERATRNAGSLATS